MGPHGRPLELGGQLVEDEAAEALEELDGDVAHARVAHHDVGQMGREVLALGIAHEVEVARAQAFGRLLDPDLALAGLLADRQQGHRRAVHARAPARRRWRPCARTGRGCGRSSRWWPRCRAARRGRVRTRPVRPGPGRSTPGRRPRYRIAEATAAPVWPAVTTASARPSRTSRMHTLMLASRLRRTACAACSSMSTHSAAWTSEM